jgi:CelD/BcsL family acetyltransferase involved in cellulose biosynthesis
MLALEWLPSPQACETLAGPWQRLAEQDPAATLFGTPAWARAWMASFGDGKTARVAALRDGGELVAVVPLVAARVRRGPSLRVYHDIQPEDGAFLTRQRRAGVLPLRQIAPMAGLQSGSARAALVCRPGLAAPAWQALLGDLARRRDWDVLLLTALPEDLAPVVQAAAREAGLPVLVEPGPTLFQSRVMRWDDYFKPRHRHFRTRFRSGEQVLKQLGGGVVHVSDGASSVELLDLALDLADRSWKQQGRPGEAYHVPVAEPVKHFYRALARAHAGDAAMPVISLEVAGQLRAVLVCAVQGRRLYALQTFYDPEIARASPGARLLPALYDHCHAMGLEQIDWNGNSSWVQRFADTSTAHVHLSILRGGVGGRLLHAVAARLRAREARRPPGPPAGAPDSEEGAAP